MNVSMNAINVEPVGLAPGAPKFYSVAQVAAMFGMSAMTIYRAIAAGEFPAVRIRGRLTVPAKAIKAMADVAVAEGTLVDAADWVADSGRISQTPQPVAGRNSREV